MTATALDTASDPEFRRSGIGGSDAPPILGVPLYGRTAFHVYLEKIGQTAPSVETERMGLGKWLEDPVARKWAKDTGHRVIRARTHDDPVTGKRTRAIRRADRPFMYAHVDRFNEDGDIVEVKVVNAYRTHEFGEQGGDEIPAGIALQVHHQLACVPSAKRAYVPVLLGGDRILKFVVERDEAVIASILTIEEEFWQDNVIAQNPPPFDGSDAGDDYLRAMFPADNGEEMEADEALTTLVERYALARGNREQSEAQEKILKQEIRDAMAEAAYLVGDRFRISNKLSKDAETVHWDLVAAAYRRLVEKFASDEGRLELDTIQSIYTETKPGSRRFLVTWREGA